MKHNDPNVLPLPPTHWVLPLTPSHPVVKEKEVAKKTKRRQLVGGATDDIDIDDDDEKPNVNALPNCLSQVTALRSEIVQLYRLFAPKKAGRVEIMVSEESDCAILSKALADTKQKFSL